MSMKYEADLNVEELIGKVEATEEKALTMAMESIRELAVEYTPVETGDLAGSASISIDGNEATLEYPGPYARRQHEELTWHHETGRAKYLELAMIERKDDAMKILTDELGKEFD